MCCAVRDKYLPRKEKLPVTGANWLDGGAAHSLASGWAGLNNVEVGQIPYLLAPYEAIKRAWQLWQPERV